MVRKETETDLLNHEVVPAERRDVGVGAFCGVETPTRREVVVVREVTLHVRLLIRWLSEEKAEAAAAVEPCRRHLPGVGVAREDLRLPASLERVRRHLRPGISMVKRDSTWCRLSI
jgi:hypothetical protein